MQPESEKNIPILLIKLVVPLVVAVIIIFPRMSRNPTETSKPAPKADTTSYSHSSLPNTQQFDTPEPTFSEITQKAIAGDAKAQCELGSRYGNLHNYTESAKWYTEAAKQGNTLAMVFLGYYYESGNGVPKNKRQAAQLWVKAAELGDKTGLLAVNAIMVKMETGRLIAQLNGDTSTLADGLSYGLPEADIPYWKQQYRALMNSN